MKEYVIPKDNSSVLLKIILSGLFTFVAGLVLGLFFYRIGDFAPVTARLLSTATWIVLPIAWLALSVYEYWMSVKSSYTLLDDSFQIKTIGWFIGRHEDLYRYDSVQSVSSFSWGGGRFGSLTIRLDRQDDLVLKHVANPAEQAAVIKKLVNANRRSTNFI